MTSIDTPCDLAIIGGGLAGLTAGLAESERGLRVAIFERGADERHPCNSRFAGGAFHVAYTDPTSESDDLFAAINRVTKDEADPAHARVMADNASRTVYWLRDHGVDFAPGPTPMHKFMVTPHRPMMASLDWPDHGPDEMIKTLGRRLGTSGSSFHRNAEVTALRMEDGKCAGLRVRLDRGKETEIDAANVLIADGGFQANQEIVGKYIAKRPDLLVRRSADSATGDGIRMAEAAGAALIYMERFYGHFLAREAMAKEGFSPYPQLDQIAAAAVVIDATGRRFVNEGIGGIYMSNVVARFEDPASTYTIFDHDIWEKGPGVKSVYPANPTIERAGGTVYRASSPEDLAAQIGVEPSVLRTTLEAYNTALEDGPRVAQGIPRSDHTVPAAPLNLSALMAIPLSIGITTTMGGIAIDANMGVKRPDGSVIPGLLAAGSSTGGIEGGGTIGYVGGLIKAAVTGLIAGESAG